MVEGKAAALAQTRTLSALKSKKKHYHQDPWAGVVPPEEWSALPTDCVRGEGARGMKSGVGIHLKVEARWLWVVHGVCMVKRKSREGERGSRGC